MADFFYRLPVGAIPFIVALLFFLFFEFGYRFSFHKSVDESVLKNINISTSVGAILGLLAFMLAFTFNLANTHFEQGRLVVVEEANAIGTTYLRAELLASPHNKNVQSLLKAYVNLLINNIHNPDIASYANEYNALTDQLWEQAVEGANKYPTPTVSTFIMSLNDVFDNYDRYINALNSAKISSIIWSILLMLGIVCMLILGYLYGTYKSRSLMIILLVILAFTVVIYLIAELNSPGSGFVRFNYDSLLNVQKKMGA